MHRALTRPQLDKARPAIARLIRRDWIWRGLQPLDAVCVRRTPHDEDAWRATLTPHLDSAQSLQEDQDYAVLFFAAPVEIDCALLGGVLPLRRVNAAVTSFPFDPPRSEDVAKRIQNTLLLFIDGRIELRPLEDFAQSPLSPWVDLSALNIERAESPPRKRRLAEPKRLIAQEEDLVQPDFARAGLEELKRSIDMSRRGDHSLAGAPPLSLAALVALLVVASALLLASGSESPDTLAVIAAATIGVVLWRWLRRRGGRGAWSQGDRRSAQVRKRADGAKKKQARTSDRRSAWWAWLVLALSLIALAALGDASTTVPALVAGAGSLLLIGLVVGAVSALLGGDEPAGSPTAGPASRPAAPSTSVSRGPSLLRRLLERALRMRPITDRAYRRYARRIEELRGLFANGQIDEALKRGLSLDRREPDNSPPHADEPVFGPGVRERLLISATKPPAQRALAALPPQASGELQQLYREQAQRLAEAGDAKRAAFILAELLDDADAAVRVFADASEFETAARLAQGRRLDPAIFIPLWHKAGDCARALRLAERHGAYEVLLQSTAPEEEGFRREIRAAWSERLAGVGAYAQALEVSEPLADDTEFLAVRRRWMSDGVNSLEPDPDVLARALKALPRIDGNQPHPAEAAFDALLADDRIDAARRRQHLSERLLEPEFEATKTDEFAREFLPRIADQLPRQCLRDQAAYGLHTSIRPLTALAEAGGQATLAVDLRRLPPTPRKAQEPKRELTVGPILGAAAVIAATPMRGGRTLLAMEDGGLRLIDRNGETVWRDTVWRIRDVIAIAPGRLALIIREEPNGQSLSIFDAETRSHVEIGDVAFDAWAPHAQRDGWLVSEAAAVRNLSVASLVSAFQGHTPNAIEQLWSTPITVDGAIVALTRHPQSQNAVWLLRRDSGVLERWQVTAKTLQVSYQQLVFSFERSSASTSDLEFYLDVDKDDVLRRAYVRSYPPDAKVERSTEPGEIHILSLGGSSSRRTVEPCETGGGMAAPVFAVVAKAFDVSLKLRLDGARRGYFRDAPDADHVAIWDDLGRVVVLSTERKEVLFSNAAVRG